MAKSKQKVNKKSSAYLYDQQWKRINNYIKKLNEQGYTVDEAQLPEKLTKPNIKSVEKIKNEWDFRRLKHIAYLTTETGEYAKNESGQRVSKSSIELEEWRRNYYEKREQRNQKRRAQRWVDRAARSWDFADDDDSANRNDEPRFESQRTQRAENRTNDYRTYWDYSDDIDNEFKDAIDVLGFDTSVEQAYDTTPYGAIKRKETKYVEIEDVGLKKSDVAYRWQLIGEEDGMKVFKPKRIDEKIYVDEESFKFYVKRKSLPSVEGNAIEAIDSLIPSLDYYTKVGGKWGEYGVEVSNQLSALIDILRNADDEKYQKILSNITNNIGQIDTLMHGLLYEYKEMQNSSSNIAKLYKLITGEAMTSEVANRINNYEIEDMYLDDEY